MKPTGSPRATKNLVEEFCMITGADKALAANLLEACDNNLEMAVNMHMEGIPGTPHPHPTPAATPPLAHHLPDEGAETVRAPIPQKQEILVGGPDQIAFAFRGRRRVARSVFDKFRDFEAETKRQEEELLRGASSESVASGSLVTPSTSNSSSNSSTNSSTVPHPTTSRTRRKMKTLEDLFRPPIDLIYRGTFDAARDAGMARKRWLMVNVQDSSEFPCQVLNRDVWSNAAVKTIVKEHFIFWQVYQDSEEGQKYMMFYKVSDWPHVAVLDPRTGERLVTWNKLDALTFCDLVTEFLSSYPTLDGKTTPPKKKPRLCLGSQDSGDSIIEADEASQIEAAIKASLAESDGKASLPKVEAREEDIEDSDALETFDSDSEDVDYSLSVKQDKAINGSEESCRIKNMSYKRVESEGCLSVSENEDNEENEEEGDDWESYLGPTSDPSSNLMLRLPDGSRDIVSMPSSSKLMALVKYVGSKGFSSEQYELVTNFPRRQISEMDLNSTLKEVGLFPQETVFIQAR